MQYVLTAIQNNMRRWQGWVALTSLIIFVYGGAVFYTPNIDEALQWFLLVVAATLVSEDLTTTSVGVMVAQGKVSFWFGAFACFAGIFLGDVALYLAGRFFGRPALTRAPLKWFLRAAAVEKSSAWFAQQGSKVIFISRFIPGLRLPTYFAAGMLNTNFASFVFYFALACAVWTPLLMGLAALFGGEIVNTVFFGPRFLPGKTLLTGLILLVVIKFALQLTTWRGRRILLGKWRKIMRWEFWPPYFFYPPIIFYLVYLALKHRSLTLFTAANPAIPASGFIGESKAQILAGLQRAKNYVANYELIRASDDGMTRVAHAENFMRTNQYNFPIVLKPDVGQRGQGVQVIRSKAGMEQYFQSCDGDVIIQEYIAGAEFGVFYYRYPDEQSGHIFSITEKKFPVITGDGKRTLEELILRDERAVCMAKFYLDKQGEKKSHVPDAGERVQLVELGSHCRGAIFLDGIRYNTVALAQTIDRISRGFEGFYFGRYDIRVPDVQAFARAEGFKIIELNGVTSEATHIYDPKNNLFAAYRVLCEQWRIAFAIGAQNKTRKAQVVSVRELIQCSIKSLY